MHHSKKDCYSISSSVRLNTAGGIARLSALAALRLITNSYLAYTGRSVASHLEDAIDIFGRAPERIQQINPIGHQAGAGDEECSW